MLELADDHDPDAQRRKACRNANHGQADLLREAAQQADELAEILATIMSTMPRSQDRGNMMTIGLWNAARAALRKAGME